MPLDQCQRISREYQARVKLIADKPQQNTIRREICAYVTDTVTDMD